MNKSVAAITVSLAAGLAAAAMFFADSIPELSSGAGPEHYFDQSAAVEDRVRALEAAVAEERNARQLLEEELQILYAEIEQLNEVDEVSAVRVADVRENRERIEELRRNRDPRAIRGPADRLMAAGFAPDRAGWIAQRESELQMVALQATFDARRSGEAIDPFDPSFNSTAALRAEIGDAEYEQYLRANNRSTSVGVGQVFESSPGQRAGLQRGDQIVSYNGTRVFDVSELNQQTMLGEPGESVVVDITRDGVPMQLVLPRGPIGVTTSRFPGRR